MAKDYAKKSKGRKKSGASRGKNDKQASVGLILFVFALVAGLIALLVYLKWYLPNSEQPIKKETVTTKNKPADKKTNTKVETTEAETVEESIPFYKTHEEIVNKKVEIPIEDLKLPENKNKIVYLMPCGSFRDLSRAEELKAQIGLTGHSSKINKVNVKSGLWYRVELGPYKSKRKAESIRHRLQDNGQNYCKIWPKKVN